MNKQSEAAFTVRLSSEKQHQLDTLAKLMDRSRNWIVNQAIETFLDLNAWQIEQIKEGINAANRGELKSHEDIMARLEKKIAKAQKVHG